MTYPQRGYEMKSTIDVHCGNPYCQACAQLSRVFTDTSREMDRQDAKWGKQDRLADGMEGLFAYYGVIPEDVAKDRCQVSASFGKCDWMQILVEEVAEVIGTLNNTPHLREELIQVAAVCTQWVEAIDRRVAAQTNAA